MEIVLKLNLTPFNEGLKSAVRLGQIAKVQIEAVLNHLNAKIDTAALDQELDKLNQKIKGFEASHEVNIDVDTETASQAIVKFQEDVEKSQSPIRRMRDALSQWGFALNGVVMAVQGTGRAVESLVGEALSAQAAFTKVETAVRSSGNAAGRTAEDYLALANQMEGLVAVDADEIMDKVTAPLLTFHRIGMDIFPQTQQAVLDLSRALGIDMQGAAIQLGKALNDPTEGLTALRRSGVSFTDAQTEVIKSLYDTGQVAEAQRLILQELNKEFGGQAEAFAGTYAGKLQEFKIAIGNLQETVGNQMLPVITAATSVIGAFVDVLSDNGVILTAVVGSALEWVVVLKSATVGGGVLTTVIHGMTAAWTRFSLAITTHPIVATLTAVGIIVAVIVQRIQSVEERQREVNRATAESIRLRTQEMAQIDQFTQKINQMNREQLDAERQKILSATTDMLLEWSDVEIELIDLRKKGNKDEIEAAQNRANAYKAIVDSYNQQMDAVKALQKARENGSDSGPDAAYYDLMRFKAKGYFDYMVAQYEREKQIRINQNGLSEALAEEEKQAKIEALREEQAAWEQSRNKRNADISKDRQDARETAAEEERRAEETRRAEEQRVVDLAEMTQKYRILSVRDVAERKLEELNAEREAELAKADAVQASEALKQQIRDFYLAQTIATIEADGEAERQIQADKEQTLFEFNQRELDLNGRRREADLAEIDNYYANNRTKLIDAGVTEEQITSQTEKAKQQVRDRYNKQNSASFSQALGTMADAAKSYGKEGFAIWKAASIAQAIVDTYAAANTALKSAPPPFNFIMMAANIAAGLANVKTIAATEMPTAESGGLLTGNRHSQGGIILEAEGGEYIVNREATAKWLPLLRMLNGEGSDGGIIYADGGMVGGYQRKSEADIESERQIKELRAVQKSVNTVDSTVKKSGENDETQTNKRHNAIMGQLGIIIEKMSSLGDAINRNTDATKNSTVWGTIRRAFGFASGGYVSGYGGPRDDANIIAISAGEYVVNAAATAKWLPILEHINTAGGTAGNIPYESIVSIRQNQMDIEGIVSGLSRVEHAIKAMNVNLVSKRLEVNFSPVIETSDPETRIRRDTITRNRLTARGEKYDPNI